MISHENKLFPLEPLTPMITSQNNPENQLSKTAATLQHATLGQAFRPDIAHHETLNRTTYRSSPENVLLRGEVVRLESLTYKRPKYDLNWT